MLTKADLIDVMEQGLESDLDTDTIVDALLDTIIAKTGSPRTVDEMLRVKEGRE